MLNVTMFHHLNTNRWDLHINQQRGESCIKHVCCISRMNFYRSDFKHKIYGLYTGKYGIYKSTRNPMNGVCQRNPQRQMIKGELSRLCFSFKRGAIIRFKHYQNRSVCDALRICCFNVAIS